MGRISLKRQKCWIHHLPVSVEWYGIGLAFKKKVLLRINYLEKCFFFNSKCSVQPLTTQNKTVKKKQMEMLLLPQKELSMENEFSRVNILNLKIYLHK